MKYFVVNGAVYTAFNENNTNFNHYDIISEINFSKNYIIIEEYGSDKVTRFTLFDEIKLSNNSQDFKTLD